MGGNKTSFKKGHSVSKTIKKKISISLKKYYETHVHPAKTRKRTKAELKRISKLRLGKEVSKAHRKAIGKASKGHTRTRSCTEIEAIKNDKILNWAKYRKLKKEILIRDNYTCRICKAKKSRTTHHKKPRKLFPELCFKKSNIITVCRKCHINIHLH